MVGKNEEITTQLSQVRLWGLTGENEMERQGWRIHWCGVFNKGVRKMVPIWGFLARLIQ